MIGVGVLGFIKNRDFPAIYYMCGGILVITVYAEIFSIFAQIGAVSHILMLAAAAFFGYRRRKQLSLLWSRFKTILFSWEGFFYVCFILGIAFFTSRGIFHTDTNIYHAAAIRIYEEYGLIKGIGNLQVHYAYNSSYLAFASIFSMRWLFGRSLHTTTGLIEVVLCLYAFHGLKDFKRHASHVSDMMRIGILFYALVMLNGSMSPATDYVTMLFALFVLTAWCENAENYADVTQYSLLSVCAVYVMTLKFSACLLVLLVLYPAVLLMKAGKWKEIALYIGCGMIILLPFLFRNYLISGWLLYPFDGIDIFHVAWKIPKEYLTVDADQIKVWGRCLYDVEKINWPVSRWMPVWWEHQERYEQMLLGAAFLGCILQIVIWTVKLIKRQRLRADYFVLTLAVWGNLAVWFFMAPYIRYGLAFLFTAVMFPVGESISEKKSGIYSILTGGLLFCIVSSLSPYWDHYITDAGVFVKQNIKQPYYILQKDYDTGHMESCELDGNIVYYAVEYEINDYHVFPGTCYKHMLDRSMLMGTEIEDGFMAR